MNNNKFHKLISLIISIYLMNCLFSYFYPQTQSDINNYPNIEILLGIWEGNLDFESNKAPLAFKVFKDRSNKIKVTLDSPLQNAFNVPLGELLLNQNEVKIDAPDLYAYYLGTLIDNSTLIGVWNQNGDSFPLNLIKKSFIN